ncbi:MAG: acyl-CoA dehydrogenase family protein [Mycobacteriales bacterium]
MDFRWTSEEQAFRKELERFLDDLVPADYDAFALPEEEAGDNARRFGAQLAEHGFLTPSWPAEFGGRDASPFEQVIVAEEMVRHGEPRALQYMSVNYIGPTIMMAGSEEQKAHHLPRITRGDVLWCQGFSEPDAGSDLASLRTFAAHDGDDFVINGEKIWTSGADVADFCFLLARTDRTAQKHRGLSLLLVPMDTPGIEVRKVPGVVGEGAFHHLVFTDVRVPRGALLGEENEGWALVRRALAFERVGVAKYARNAKYLDRFMAWARENGRAGDPVVRRQFAEAQAAVDTARILAMVVANDRAKGRADSPSAYVYRVASVRAERVVMELGIELMGPAGLEDDSLADRQVRWGVTAGVAGGSAEMQLNTVAQLVLGLPRTT